MKSKVTKIQILKKGILLVLALAVMLPTVTYATTVSGLTLQESTALEKLMYGEIGSVVRKIEEHFKSNTTLYIVNETQLRALAEYVNNGNSCLGKAIHLLNDITLSSRIDWTPIGNSYSEFAGVFYGNGHTISNLTYRNYKNYETENGYSQIGLFGVIGARGVVEKVNMHNSYIESAGVNNIHHVGTIAGTNYGTILECTGNWWTESITSSEVGTEDNNYIGLLVGENKGRIDKKISTTKPKVGFTINDTKITGDFKVYQKQENEFVEITNFQNDINLKINDVIRIEYTLDKYLYTGLENGRTIKLADTTDENGNITAKAAKENYPQLKFAAGLLLSPIEVTQKEVTLEDGVSKPQTKLIYEYEATELGIQNYENLVRIDFTKNLNKENLYVYYSNDNENFNTGDKINLTATQATIKGVAFRVDTKNPYLLTEASVAEMSSSRRYPEGKEIVIKLISSEKIQAATAPEIKVSFNKSGVGKYNYQTNSRLGNAKHVDATINKDGNTVWTYSYIIAPGDEGTLSFEYLTGNITDLVGNVIDLTSLETVEKRDVYADTTEPSIEIIPVEVNNSITNKDKVVYQFKISEEVLGFTKDCIIVNNGTAENLSEAIKNEDGTVIYTMAITPSIANGNVGDLQVMIEQNACQDLVGHGNVRAQSVVRVDKKAPILLNLEAYGTSDIVLNKEIDVVKENYKLGETITVIATFDENIAALEDKLPVLSLQFSQSGNAKGSVNGRLEGNKIVYTYTITTGDEGILSVRGLTGTVVDNAGNETKVTKRVLDGDTIIADNVAPKLTGISVIAPDFEYDELLKDGENKRYGIVSKAKDKNTMIIITEYSEDIYNLNENTINSIVSETAPVLQLRFGGTNAKGNIRIREIIGNKISYEYDITSGDNGRLSIASLIGEISDIAGNRSTVNVLPNNILYYEEQIREENKVEEILADTNKANITLDVTAINKDDEDNQITGNGNFYRKGTIITVTAKTDEYVYKNTNHNLQRYEKETAPQLGIKFATNGQGVGVCKNVEYKDNQTIFTYEYIVKENDNGKLTVSMVENLGYDIALNGNSKKEQPKDNIVADTIKPTYKDNNGDIHYANGKYTVTFNEPLYYLENNQVKAFGDNKKAPTLKFEGLTTEYIASVNNNTITYTGNYVNAKPYLSNSSLCDRAGNLYAYYDQQAPVLSKIEVVNPITGTYKANTEITIVATFNERITGTAPSLQLQFSQSGNAKGNVSSGEIENNIITYKYTIKEGDNGKLSIKAFSGTGLKDLSDNAWVVPEEAPQLQGNVITADTEAPTLTITSDVKRTNKDVVNYTFTWSEPVYGFTIEDIEVTNGSKGTLVGKDGDTTYTLTVDTTNEGRQIVKVASGVVRDIAGNVNDERSTYNEVVIDYTKPTIRAKVNGGNYAIATDSKKSVLKEIIVVNEELSNFQYVWSTSETIPENGWKSTDVSTIEINSDINLEYEANTTGTYYLYIRVTDIAGNTLEAKTKAFIVSNPEITLTPNVTEKTKEDVIVTVDYGAVLTDNRKAGVSGKTHSADSAKVIVEENGTVYAEATDKFGNKVYKTLEITNIDKTKEEPPVSGNDPIVVFEDLTVIQKDGTKYVKISPTYTTEMLTAKMDEKSLCEKTPEYTNLTSDNKLKTGTEIKIEGKTQYIVIVKGDVNCDGKVDFLGDIVMLNNYRIGLNKNLSTIQKLAGDINGSGKIEFIPDIVAINNFRLGKIKSL